MAIAPLPSPPSRAEPDSFSSKADAFLGQLPTFASEANSLAADVNSKQSTASSAASTATLKAAEAVTSATNASTSATNASTSATNASTSATTAQNWAIKTDGPVSGSEYSAKYWGQIAQGFVVGTLFDDANISTVKTWSSSKINSTCAKISGQAFTGNISVANASEANVTVNLTSFPSAKFYSIPGGWGMYSDAGGSIIQYVRSTGKVLVNGIDTSLLVQNNAGTYNINISGNASTSTSSGYATISGYAGSADNADTIDGYHASSLVKTDNGYNNVGTFAFLRIVSGAYPVEPGELRAGSDLRYSSVEQGTTSTITPTGTWRCCGYARLIGGTVAAITLWQKVA